jgi:TatD DNase family protein
MQHKRPRLIDTHTHLHCEHFDNDREQVLEAAAAAGVARIIEVGYDLDSSRAALALAERYPQIFAVVGIQPNHAHEAPPGWLDGVRTLAAHPKAVAIGEIGLDYYRDYAPRDLQQRVFIEQLALARELGLPVVIHSREAHQDTADLLHTHARGQPGVMHSFSGNWEHARACLDVGFLLSFSGPVTFAKATTLHEVARRAPADAILVETDSPFLTPHPHRGQRNEPAHVALVAQQIATLRQAPLEEVAATIWDNADRVFFG